jgi:hypothetical protein
MRPSWIRLLSVGALVSAPIGCNVPTVDEEPTAATREALHSAIKLQLTTPTACWVKDPDSSTSDAVFDAKTASFQDIMREWEDESGLRYQWKGRCSAPTTEVSGTNEVLDVYPEDVRILWNELGRRSEYPIPGRGCGHDNDNGNWGSFPSSKASYRHCRHNVSFGKNVSRNNVLHESGHNLGFLHEQARSDNDSLCQGSGAKTDQELITGYDLYSVMHYTYEECGNPGNLGTSGLSFLDRLGVSIAYPPEEDRVQVAHNGMSWNGFYAVRADAVIQPSWYARGAMERVFGGIEWSTDFIGVPREVVSNDIAVPIGTILPDGGGAFVHVAFTDPWGRDKHEDLALTVSTAIHTAMITTLL